jgi:putative membrane protein
MNILFRWVISAVAVIITAYILPGVTVSGFLSALVVAVILGLLNVFIRPILLILTLPINILTLGLFTFVINAVIILLASGLSPGFHVDSFLWALLFSIVLSLVNAILDSLSKPASINA